MNFDEFVQLMVKVGIKGKQWQIALEAFESDNDDVQQLKKLNDLITKIWEESL